MAARLQPKTPDELLADELPTVELPADELPADELLSSTQPSTSGRQFTFMHAHCPFGQTDYQLAIRLWN